MIKKWYNTQWFSLVMCVIAVILVIGVAYLVIDKVRYTMEGCDKFCSDKIIGNYTDDNGEIYPCIEYKCGVTTAIAET